jgi:endonuclease/exonuclease/phosphatase family metal-dependent hydrolase
MLTFSSVLCFVAVCTPAYARADDKSSDIKVMSFNIRYGTAEDGENHWDKRKDFLVDTVKAFGPDLLGTQETLGFQHDFLAKKLDGYGVLGVGRDDGKEKGEMMAVYWREARFEKIEGGHFWLSTTPEEAGSKSWDTSLPRMATWVKLKDKQGGKPVLLLNTHFDHWGWQARLESAKLLRDKIVTLGQGCSVIITGDFNTGEDSAPYQALFGHKASEESPVRDSYRICHPQKGETEGTFSGFRAGPSQGSRIDWIGVSRDWTVVAAGIDRTAKEGKTPSDHFPVTAVLRR